MNRRALLLLAMAFFLFFPGLSRASTGPDRTGHSWPLWNRFKHHFLQQDGRVIDRTDRDKTTSEGEAYTLFFSLVSGDRSTFREVFLWIRDNLSGGDPEHRLPAWLWGKRPNGTWGILDVNSASDADGWIAYSLLEAGRLWHRPSYEKAGRHLLFLIWKNETRFLPGYGWVLLPGPYGFVLPDGTTRQNPSYLPFELLALFGSVEPRGPWPFIEAAFVSHLPAIAPRGFSPDWFAVKRGGLIVTDPVRGATGSYDAIRVYLWSGMLPGNESFRGSLLRHLGGMRAVVATGARPPLVVDTSTGKTGGKGSPGFSAALLPYLQSMGCRPELEEERRQLAKALHDGLYGSPPDYYDQVLALFGEGSLSGRFSFDPLGRIRVPGSKLPDPSPSPVKVSDTLPRSCQSS